MDLSQLMDTPARDSINSGLTSPPQSLMLKLFGKPGELTTDCSEASRGFAKFIVTDDVGPFRVTGHKIAVAELKKVFDDVKADRLDLYQQVKTAGMLCCRAVRGRPGIYSNHSWGFAVDLYFGSVIDAMGDNKTQVGLRELYYFFHKHGWYWGAGFGNNREDSMHFEFSVEKLKQLHIP